MNTFAPSLSTLLLVCLLAGSAHAQEVKGDAKAAQGKIAMCIGCHGIAGYQASFPEVYKVPKISGQGAKYLASALAAYKKGDRKHPAMRGITDNLSEQDMADLAAYYEASGRTDGATMPAAAAAAAAPASGDVTELLNKGGCAGCHGGSLSNPVDAGFPKIAGQHPDYLFVALKSYKAEGLATWGRANPVMGGIVKQFSNAELKALAAYVGALPGELRTVPQASFK